jgi:hypothetical protein
VCTEILPRIGDRGRVTVIGIACFERGFETESLWVSGETDFDPSCKLFCTKNSKPSTTPGRLHVRTDHGPVSRGVNVVLSFDRLLNVYVYSIQYCTLLLSVNTANIYSGPIWSRTSPWTTPISPEEWQRRRDKILSLEYPDIPEKLDL